MSMLLLLTLWLKNLRGEDEVKKMEEKTKSIPGVAFRSFLHIDGSCMAEISNLDLATVSELIVWAQINYPHVQSNYVKQDKKKDG